MHFTRHLNAVSFILCSLDGTEVDLTLFRYVRLNECWYFTSTATKPGPSPKRYPPNFESKATSLS